MNSLDRFIKAQEKTYSIALREIQNGYKESHWMWYIFPQLAGLGSSRMSEYYGIKDLEEAKAYLQHPVLGKRLIEITEQLLRVASNDAEEIMGFPDNLKLQSCMTLFNYVSSGSLFSEVLDKFFCGKPDSNTLKRIEM